MCGSKNDRTVRYSLDGSARPLAVPFYTYEALPVDEKAALPSPDAITAALRTTRRFFPTRDAVEGQPYVF
ncbi:hypothetical protein [Glutamicibacter arilaitensis]|uniref:hypothetical protein n=1 Tax=Glutamicibacter arilaitensis TaxID=256701 RepID=UPI00384F21DE